MPAEFDTGFFVRTPAWHLGGEVHDDYPESWAQAREWGGLMWEPVKVPNFGFNGIRVDGTVTHDPADAESGDYFVDQDATRIIRDDTGARLAVRDGDPTIITHEEMGAVVEAILEQPNVKYDTAGSLQGGRSVWALVYLDEPITLPGDNSLTLPYCALLNRHDGQGSFKALPTTVRVQCSNTFSAAEAEGERNNVAFTFRHTKSWRDHIEEARQTIRGLRRDFSRYVELATDWAQIPVTAAQAEAFVVEFIPSPPEALVSDRVAKNVETARQAVRDILAGPTTETIRGTAFGLVQAAGEYLDHYRRARSADSHYARQLLRPEPLKTQAVELVRELVKA
jgi:phage/plasmid-like protein (TIGR03299 family)